MLCLISLYALLGDKGKKELDYATSLVAGVGIVYTILLTVQNRRASAAARFAERWNNPDFCKIRRAIGPIIRQEREVGDADRSNLAIMLNFFEEMSISVSLGEAQELMLRKFFKSAVIQSVTVLGPWIAERQKFQPTAYGEYLKLVRRWRDLDL